MTIASGIWDETAEAGELSSDVGLIGDSDVSISIDCPVWPDEEETLQTEMKKKTNYSQSKKQMPHLFS